MLFTQDRKVRKFVDQPKLTAVIRRIRKFTLTDWLICAIVCQLAHPFHMTRILLKLIMISSEHSQKHDFETILIMKSKISGVESKYKLLNFQTLFKCINFSSTFSQIVVSFKEELFLPTKRSERNPINNFIANAGGLFGLFMGASLLSVFELIYFFTLRIIVSRRKQHKIQQEELEKQPGTFEFLP